MLLAGPLLVTFFHYGEFNEQDVRMSSQALIAFSAGLLGFILVKVLAPGFYARQDTKTPVRIGMISMGANIVLSVSLVYSLKHVGLALAITLAAFVNAGLLFRQLRQFGVYMPGPGWPRYFVRIALASALMGLMLAWGAGELDAWLKAGAGARILHLAVLVVGGVFVYAVSLLLFGVRPHELVSRRPGAGGQ
jgi:putative peptidoglycan lipid II flippase